MSTIYALIDPTTNQPFYIGVTKRSLSRRLYEHINYQGVGTSSKKERIKDIISKGLMPTIVALFNIAREASYSLETICVNLLRTQYELLQVPRNSNIKAAVKTVKKYI